MSGLSVGVAGPHPVTLDAGARSRSHEGAVPARTVPTCTVRPRTVCPRPVPETREGLL
ncbi:hypothetical protein ACIQF5_30605 [Streptomyces goshikiensis]|uniref:hypothetical protein n=1 Tax=Streptomyces goshikiensis TaxID=1942 RepID=UPI00382F31C5